MTDKVELSTESLLRRVKKLQEQNKVLSEAVEYINDIAPDMYKYNEIELKMVMKAREALEKNKGIR